MDGISSAVTGHTNVGVPTYRGDASDRENMKNVMVYERTPLKSKQLKRTFMAKQTNDINRLSTMQIFRRLYQRHQVLVWEAALAVTWTWILVSKFN